MAGQPIPESVARKAWALVKKHGSALAAATAAGVNDTTLRRHYMAALALGLPDVRTSPRALAAMTGTATPVFEVAEVPVADQPIEELIAARKKAFARRQQSEDAKALIPVRVNVEGPYGILHMGDPHLDDDGCDWATLERHLSLIDKNEALFAANVGDLTNNWVGRLARLYANQSTTAADAVRLIEWFLGRVRWLYIVGGNHDVWSGAQDPVKWFARNAGALYQWHGVRLGLNSGDFQVRINARHDFAGTSQWNGAHAPAKAARLGFTKDHIYTCGHRHAAAHNTLFWENGEHVAHAVRVGTYKVFDDFADAKGFPRENMPAAVTIVNPQALRPSGTVTVFWDVEEAAEYLRWLRRTRKRAA